MVRPTIFFKGLPILVSRFDTKRVVFFWIVPARALLKASCALLKSSLVDPAGVYSPPIHFSLYFFVFKYSLHIIENLCLPLKVLDGHDE
jgi:hypothetical protein